MSQAIFITGAASGIGREVARLFARHGWFVGLYDVNESDLTNLAGQIRQDRCCSGVLDVSDPENWKRAITQFAKHTNQRMDVLFNSAGILLMGPFVDTPLDVHLKTIQVNATGTLIGIYSAFPLLSVTPRSRVINMSSASALYGTPDLASYSASKFAIRGLTEALNIEFERYGIAVCDIMPLYVNTPMVAQQSYRAGSLRFFGNGVSPEYVAEAVWTAAHGNRVHWVLTATLNLTAMVARYFPPFERLTMRYFSKQSKT